MHNTITGYLSRVIVLFCLLSPIGLLEAGGTSGSIISDASDTEPNLSSTIPNSTPDFTTETKTSNTGKTLTCVNYTGDPECAGTGNPINVITGNKYQHDIDMPALPGIMGLSLERHYNSLHMGLGQLGYGWRLNYETNLYVISNTIQIVKADGSRVIFNRSILNPNDCACQNPAQGHVMIYPGVKGQEYTWFQLDGTQLHFNHQGKLERISAPTGESVQLTRGLRGELLRVTDPQGRSLIMHYADKKASGFKGIIAIDTPVGRFEYAHNNDPQSLGISNLILVRKPTGTDHQTLAHQTLEQHYHYGEADYIAQDMAAANAYPAIPHAAHLLTGISHRWQTKDPTDNSKTISHNKRYRTWAYDNLGRGILSVHGTPKQLDAQGQRKPNTGINQVNLSYQLQTPKQTAKQTASQQSKQSSQQASNKPYPRITRKGEIGTTIITNSLGQQTTYTYRLIAGEYRLHKVIGAGCAECSEANVVYAYDEQARITHITKVKPTTDGKGNTTLQGLHTTQTEYDSVGRIKRVSTINYINGKAQTPQLKVRYQYPSTPTFPVLKNAINGTQEPHQVTSKPSLIAVPSVIKGKEHQWHITYNDHGQPLKVTETGYAPALPTAQSTTPQLMSRTTGYRYSEINGRSLLSQTDGPLPNGKTNSPKDSDITQYQYNQRGELLTKVIHPLGLAQTFEYDDSGANPSRLLIQQMGMDQQLVNYGYSKMGALSFVKKGNAEIQLAYDFNGRVTQYRRNDGNKIAVNYDDAKSSIRYVLADGQQLIRYYDAEHRPTKQVWQDKQGKPLINPSEIGYDEQTGQPEYLKAPSGSETVFNYDDNGALASTTQGRKVNKQAFDPVSHLLAVKQNDALYILQKDPTQSALALTLPNGATHIEVRDDFGRIIMNQHPDSGIKIAEYDTVNHTTAVYQLDVKTLSKQRSTHAQYDVLGRITEERHINHAPQQSKQTTTHQSTTADAEIISYQYQGTRLTNISSPAQDTHYQYNALGQLTQQTVTLKDGNIAAQTHGQVSKALTFTTDYTYDPFGRIQTVKLPEQALLTHEYNSIGQLDNIDYQGPAHSWWLKAIRWVWHDYGTEPLITNLATNSVHGLTGFTHSNGLSAKAKHNKAGQLVAWQDGAVSSQLQFNQEDKLESITTQTPHIINAAQINQPSTINQVSPSTQTQQLDYNVYGQLTQVKAKATTQANVTAPQNSSLKEAIKVALDESYQLDLNGNRLSQQDNTYQYQPNSDQLLAVQGNHHTKYQYNSLGEPVQIQQQSKQTKLNRQIHYGARGQITSISDNGKQTAQYQYNHARQRTHKQTQNQNTYYLWHGGLIDAEIEQSAATSNNASNNTSSSNTAHITKRYIYLGLKPVAVIDYNADNKANIAAIHTDYLGTPQAITNEKQQVIWRAEYTPFGKIRNQQSVPLVVAKVKQGSNGFISTANANTNPQASFTFNLRFAGQYEDSETGYYYNWHRYYNPETGRYLTPDPIGLQGGQNAYAYTNHDPAMSVDPWGLYRLVMGFEVNDPNQFKNGIMDLNGDYGHAFFYLVDNDNKISSTFSFGPAEQMTEIGQLIGVRGNLDYKISETSQLTSIDINAAQYFALKAKIASFRLDVLRGKEYYWVAFNNTCAETVVDTVGSWYLGLGLPDGKSLVKVPDEFAPKTDNLGLTENGVSKFGVTNPYGFYNNLVNLGYGFYEHVKPLDVLKIGSVDPWLNRGVVND